MKQLGVLDAAFVNLEQSNTPQHVGGLGIYDPSTAPGGFVRFKQVIARTEARLARLPLFRTRLVEVPGGLDRPYWVKDAHFDVEFHMRHIALPQPGDWRQLCIQVSRLHSRPLDMSRPLWEAYIIEGLDNIPNLPPGCFAVYTKMHHALVDGAGGASFMGAIHDLVANPTDEELLETEPRLVDAEPSVSELLTKASINSVKNSVDLVRGAVGMTRDMSKFALDLARDKIPSPEINSPKTRFNQSVGPHRVFDAAEFPLEGFKDIKKAMGVTLNDVALGIIGGALHRYLLAKGESYEGSLATGIPLNMRERRGQNEQNNNVGSVFASLHSDIEDPVARIRAINASTAEAKQYGEASPMVDTLKIAGLFAPALSKAVAGFWSRNHLSRHIPLNISTVVSNVMGPDFPLYCAGARMVDYYGLGVLTPGMGIFHLVFSYCGKLSLSVLADRDIMPDPELYHDLLVASYEETYAAAAQLLDTDADKAAVRAKAKVESPKRKSSTAKAKPKATTKPKAKRTAAAKTTAARKAKAGGKPGEKPASKKAAAQRKTAAKAPAKKNATKKASSTRGKAPAKPSAAPAARTGAKAMASGARKTNGAARKVKVAAPITRPKARRKATAPVPKLQASS